GALCLCNLRSAFERPGPVDAVDTSLDPTPSPDIAPRPEQSGSRPPRALPSPFLSNEIALSPPTSRRRVRTVRKDGLPSEPLRPRSKIRSTATTGLAPRPRGHRLQPKGRALSFVPRCIPPLRSEKKCAVQD